MLLEHTTTRLTPEVTSEKKLRTITTTRKRSVFSIIVLDDVTVFEAAELDAIALLADMWDNDPDAEVSAQLVQASAQAYFSHGEGKVKGKGKSKGKGKGKGKFRVRPLCLPVDDRRQQLRELKAKIECHACGRKGHWAHDRECAMLPSSLSSKPQRRHNYTLPANQRRLRRVSFLMTVAITSTHS